MKEPSPGLKISRRRWLLAGLAAPLFPASASDNLIITSDGDSIHISSLGIHFLRGNSLTRLKDGSTVEYVATVGLFHDQFVSPFKRFEQHFVVSYDVLGAGDLFSVSLPGSRPRRRTNLSLSAAETWCIENVIVPTGGMPNDEPFWLQLDLRTMPPKLTSILDGTWLHIDIAEVLTPGKDERQVFRVGPRRLNELVPLRRGRAG